MLSFSLCQAVHASDRSFLNQPIQLPVLWRRFCSATCRPVTRRAQLYRTVVGQAAACRDNLLGFSIRMGAIMSFLLCAYRDRPASNWRELNLLSSCSRNRPGLA